MVTHSESGVRRFISNHFDCNELGLIVLSEALITGIVPAIMAE